MHSMKSLCSTENSGKLWKPRVVLTDFVLGKSHIPKQKILKEDNIFIINLARLLVSCKGFVLLWVFFFSSPGCFII